MKKLLYILILIISLFIINNLVRSIYNLWQKSDLVNDAKVRLQKEKNEQEKLKDQLARVKRSDFVEEEARNKLFMVKPGEKVVLLDEGQVREEEKGSQTTQKTVPVWQQWWNTFFAH